MPDLEPEDIQELLSIPAASIPGQVTRRRFLQGAAASAGALSMLPSIFDPLAALATPVGPNEGILVVLQLGGGNDGLNTVIPRTDSRYKTLRGTLAITNPLPLTSALGLHPALPKLKARYDAGKVAIVQGVGQTGDDHSHFSSTATWMAGTASSARSSGWLGRWLDGVPESTEGLRAVTMGSSIPLHLQGSQAAVTALTGSDLFGADHSDPARNAVYDVIDGFAGGPTGKGQWADLLAAQGASAIDLATDFSPSFTPTVNTTSLVGQLTVVARLINADLGIRVFNASLGSFDTHDGQLNRHQALLAELDAAIDAFYATLSSAWLRRVSLLTFSEFGRRGMANASLGTDHGKGSVLFVIGDNVKGGLYGEAPKLDKLDARGDVPTSVDFRSVYATVLGSWLGADVDQVMGGTFEDLKLFRGTPGQVVTGPVTTGPWVPFATAADLVRQQYRDFLGREGDAGGVSFWANRLNAGTETISHVIASFLDSPEFGRSMAPAARLALTGLGGPPAFADLQTWTAAVKAKHPLTEVADGIMALPEFTQLYGALADGPFVDAVWVEASGKKPSATTKSGWVTKLGNASATRGDVLIAAAGTEAAIAHLTPSVNVLMTYAGLLQRKPDPGGWTYWVNQAEDGTSIQRLIAQFFTSTEYRRRFD